MSERSEAASLPGDLDLTQPIPKDSQQDLKQTILLSCYDRQHSYELFDN